MADYEKLRFYRDEVKHEFNLLAMRSTMLVLCQSFLVVPFAILKTTTDFAAVSATEYLIAALGVLLATKAISVSVVGLPGAQGLGGDVAKVRVVLDRQELALGMIVRALLAAAHSHKQAVLLPVVGPILKLALLPAWLVANRRPVLLASSWASPLSLTLIR